MLLNLVRPACVIVLCLLTLSIHPALAGRTQRVSLSAAGAQANADAHFTVSVSADGNRVVFATTADNLVAGDTNGFSDIYLRDIAAGTTELISKTPAGAPGNGASLRPKISPDGRHIAYASHAGDLVADDINGCSDLFLYDTQDGSTTLLSMSSVSVQANADIGDLAINDYSIGSRSITTAFSSRADNLVPADTNGTWDIFVRDGFITQRVSITNAGGQANGSSFSPALSGGGMGGNFVAFHSLADNLVPGDTNGRCDIFVHDRLSAMTIRVSLGNGGGQSWMGDSTDPAIDDSGLLVAFVSDAGDLMPDDTNGMADIFLRDRLTATTALVSAGLGGAPANGPSGHPMISAGGAYVIFMSEADNLVAGDTNGAMDLFRYTVADGAMVRVSLADDDSQALDRSYGWGTSPSGRHVAFASHAANLVSGDTNDAADIFLRDIDGTGAGTAGAGSGTAAVVEGGATARISLSENGGQGNGPALGPAAVSGDGRYAAFASLADDLVANDTNGLSDIFLYDRISGTSLCITRGWWGEANGASFAPLISADGSTVVFASHASNLIPNDTNGVADIFLYGSGVIMRVSVSIAGVQGNAPSIEPAISEDGRFIAFASLADNLIPDDTNGTWDVFVHDIIAAITYRVSITALGGQSDNASFKPSVSGNGRLVAFESRATNLVANDTNGRSDVFVYDLLTSAIERISVTSGGYQDLSGASHSPAISADGNYVAFVADGRNLFVDDFNTLPDIVVHNRATNALTRIKNGTVESNGWCRRPAISADGRYVAFSSDAHSLIGGDTNGAFDVLRYDRVDQRIDRISVAYDGTQALGRSYLSGMSADGNLLAFRSQAANLVPGDTNGAADIFLRDVSAAVLSPEIRILGNGLEIADGDLTPAPDNDTDFGPVAVGASAAAVFTIENTGNSLLALMADPVVAVNGSHAAEFSVTAQPANHVTGGGAAAFTVAFAPAGAGLRSASITVDSNDSDEGAYTFALQGTGLVPDMVLFHDADPIANGDHTPDPADGTDFGAVLLDGAPATATFTVENQGSAGLMLSGTPAVAISGPHTADFTITAQPAASISPAGSATFDIAFTPSDDGIRTAVVEIATNDPTDNPFTFTIQGYGNRAPVAVAVASEAPVAGQAVDLDGSGSHDPGNPGGPLTCAWTAVSWPDGALQPAIADADQIDAGFTPDLPGAYVFQLTVSDGFASGSQQVAVDVSPALTPTAGGGGGSGSGCFIGAASMQ